MQCVAACCSVLQCVAVCCSVTSVIRDSSQASEFLSSSGVLQRVAVCCNALQCVAISCIVLPCDEVALEFPIRRVSVYLLLLFCNVL